MFKAKTWKYFTCWNILHKSSNLSNFPMDSIQQWCNHFLEWCPAFAYCVPKVAIEHFEAKFSECQSFFPGGCRLIKNLSNSLNYYHQTFPFTFDHICQCIWTPNKVFWEKVPMDNDFPYTWCWFFLFKSKKLDEPSVIVLQTWIFRTYQYDQDIETCFQSLHYSFSNSTIWSWWNGLIHRSWWSL